ncbi:putative glycerol-3-phosphate acyltransferase 2 [Dichanthelium oligosanthes]|uniref:Putative glycerol-3-phosphate acyltransferase 2 n=1 Tax=Dichanthelium oligosanthes TaxID=888268 RepID=A0A1E5VRT9_9POAL|nr:putative glycerol-3-phosphate acyltransferase 2 [Dichanthelium oligosanthes]
MAENPDASPPLYRLTTYDTLVFDVEACLLLLRSPRLSTFPYFMLVAVEAGGFLRGLLLLLAYPLILCLPSGRGTMRTKAMVLVSFFGLREKEVARVCRAVLPKFFLEVAAMEGLELVRTAARRMKAKRVVAVCSGFPSVMIEAFIRDHLCIDAKAVLGCEVMNVVGGRYVGMAIGRSTSSPGMCLSGKLTKEAGSQHAPSGTVCLVGEDSRMHRLLPCCCQVSSIVQVHQITNSEKAAWRSLPREKYPKPLVFHDGRLAFLPTPSAAVAMYTFLPLGITLAVVRSAIFKLFPYSVALPLSALTGMRSRLVVDQESPSPLPPPGTVPVGVEEHATRGRRLFACNHRTLIDPIAISCCQNRPVMAVTYGLSRFSELISPVRTARLTRDRDEDHRRMAALLARGDLVVCPEGTTCREPYLLRFSPLFAGLADEVTPVALDTHVDMFYGTSTKPSAKWLDAIYFLMNAWPEYRVEVLEPVLTTPVVDGGGAGGDGHRIDVANRVQRVIGEALGYELTRLTRKDKYNMMAGEGESDTI